MSETITQFLTGKYIFPLSQRQVKDLIHNQPSNHPCHLPYHHNQPQDPPQGQPQCQAEVSNLHISLMMVNVFNSRFCAIIRFPCILKISEEEDITPFILFFYVF